MREEEWRPVVGHEGFYEVSDLGRVRSIDRWFIRSDGHRQFRRGRMLSPKRAGTRRNYLYVTLRFGRPRSIHALVCEAFRGPRPSGHQVAHSNGISTDNRAENLRWATPLENTADKYLHGTMQLAVRTSRPGERSSRAALTWDQVIAMRSEYLAGGVSQRELARRHGVSKSQAFNIVSGKQWTTDPRSGHDRAD
jgi:hypothetical protein